MLNFLIKFHIKINKISEIDRNVQRKCQAIKESLKYEYLLNKINSRKLLMRNALPCFLKSTLIKNKR